MTLARFRLKILRAAIFGFLFVVCANPAAADILYGVTGAGGNPSSLYTINPLTGAVTSNQGIAAGGAPITVGGVSVALSGIVWDTANNTLYGVVNSTGSPMNLANSLVSIPTSGSTLGQAAIIGSTNGLLGVTMVGVGITANGSMMYGYSKTGAEGLYSINLSNSTVNGVVSGGAARIGSSGSGITPATSGDGLAVDSSGNIYLSSGGSSTGAGKLYTLDPVLGTPTSTTALTNGSPAPPSTETQIKGTLFDGSTMYGVEFVPSTFTADLVTMTTGGVVTDMGTTQTQMVGLAFAPAAVPEPSSFILAGLAALGFVLHRLYSRRLRLTSPCQ